MIYQTQCHASNAYTQTCQQVGDVTICLWRLMYLSPGSGPDLLPRDCVSQDASHQVPPDQDTEVH